MIGLRLDKRPLNSIWPVGMGFTLVGLLPLAFRRVPYLLILFSVAVVGIGSAVFYPQASRVARAALGRPARLRTEPVQGGRELGTIPGAAARGFHRGVLSGSTRCRPSRCSRSRTAILLIRWAAGRAGARGAPQGAAGDGAGHWRRLVRRTLFVLIVMLFSKVALSRESHSYYTFDLIQTFGVSIQGAQVLLFVSCRGRGRHVPRRPLVDRFGARFVIWGSILGAAFTLLLPHLGFVGTVIIRLPSGSRSPRLLGDGR